MQQVKASIFCAALFISGSPLAQEQFGVAFPFKTPLSRENFRKCYPAVKAEDLARLSKVSWYGYQGFGTPEICPAQVGTDCKPGTKFFSATRIMRFSTDITPSSFNNSLNANEGGDCSYNRMGNRSFTVSRNSINAHFQAFHQERKCLGDFKTDVGDGSVDIDMAAVLNSDFSVSNTFSQSNKKSSYLGFIDGDFLNNIGVQVVGVSIVGVLPLVVETLVNTQAFRGLSNDLNFGGAGINLYSYSGVQPALDSIGQVRPQTDYIINRPASGFSREADLISVETVQVAYALELFRESFIGTRRTEIEFLAELNEISPRLYTVVVGDNLWNIVGKTYRDARLFPIIARANDLKNASTLKPGSTLKLPRWQELCQDLTGNPLAVRNGDSLWLKASRGEIPTDLRRVRTMSGRSKLIFPMELLKVEDRPVKGKKVDKSRGAAK